MTTDQIQGLEWEMYQCWKTGGITEKEWREFLAVKQDELRVRFQRGET
jgi:hypothetical protein